MKELTRSVTNRKLAGVIGGLAKRFNLDANLLRLIFIVALFPTGFFPLIIVYFVLVFVLPNEE